MTELAIALEVSHHKRHEKAVMHTAIAWKKSQHAFWSWETLDKRWWGRMAEEGPSGRLGDKRKVSIRVVDERRGNERDFSVQAGVLGEAMRYFRHCLQRGGGRDTVHMTVHCDVEIFRWLLQRAKAQHCSNGAVREPQLSVEKCVPLLVSGDYLQMDGLSRECTRFIARNLWQVCKAGSDLSKLEDRFLSDIADCLDESSLDALKSSSSKLSCPSTDLKTLSTRLFKAKAELLIQRFEHSLSRCTFCGRIFPSSAIDSLLCPSRRQLVDARACKPRARHCPENEFDLRLFVNRLRREREHTWRDITWTLLACSVALPECSNCRARFLPLDSKLCNYHAKSASGGVHQCCGSRASMFGAPCLNGCLAMPHEPSELPAEDSYLERRLLSKLKSNSKALTLPPADADCHSGSKCEGCNNSVIASVDLFNIPACGSESERAHAEERWTGRQSQRPFNSASAHMLSSASVRKRASSQSVTSRPKSALNSGDALSAGEESDDDSASSLRRRSYEGVEPPRLEEVLGDAFEDLTAHEERAVRAVCSHKCV